MAKPGVITIHDLGRMAGCSITTVSRVLNNSGAVSRQNREAVLRAVRETDFHITRARKGGRRKPAAPAGAGIVDIIQHRHTPVERLITEDGRLQVEPPVAPWSGGASPRASVGWDNSFHRGIVDGALEELARWGYRAHVRSNSDLLDPVLLSELNAPDRAGAILVGESSLDLTQFIRSCGRPIVLVDVMGSAEADVITTDNIEGIRLAFNHLYQLGHRKIGFVGVRQAPGRGNERFTAYKLNLLEHDILFRPEWVCSSSEHIADVAEGAAALLARDDRPTALMCQNDCCALGVIRAASRLNLSVPADLSVVGFDDVDSASLVTPPLTTLRVPVHQMGRRAVRELMIQIKAGAPPRTAGCRVRLTPELIVRESTLEIL